MEDVKCVSKSLHSDRVAPVVLVKGKHITDKLGDGTYMFLLDLGSKICHDFLLSEP